MDRCLDMQELEEFHSGIVDQETTREIRAHLGRCTECSARSAKIRSHLDLAAKLREAISGSRSPHRGGSSAGVGARDRAGAEPRPGDRIEGFRFVREISRTRSSSVHEAVQEGTGQRVAVKVLLTGAAADDRSRARFEREIELLGLLRHPHIVPIFASGLTGGQHYFVMPYLEGRGPDSFVREKALDTRGAVKLLKHICEAVSFAHQRGVLHRDLKPSNIIVDDRGDPHVLDFGLAKAERDGLGESLTALTLESGQIIGTPAYMAPEQAAGRTADIDTRSDVYALGVVMYRTLCGGMPYPTDGPLTATLRHIAETEPQRPSTRDRRFDRELEAILIKALEKDPARRYQSAAALVEDLDRFLEGRPVLARVPSAAYRFRKFVMRHKLPAGMAAGIALLLVGFTGTLAVQADRLAHERDGALRLAGILIDVLIKPTNRDYSDLKVSLPERYDALAETMPLELAEHPEDQASLALALGEYYIGEGKYDRAERMVRRSLELREGDAGGDTLEVAEAKHYLAAALYWQQRYAEAEPLYQDALRIRRTLLTDDDARVAETLGFLGALYAVQPGQEAKAEDHYLRSLDIRRRVLAADHPEVARSLANLATFYRTHGRFDEAEARYREAIDLASRAENPNDWDVARIHHNYGLLLLRKPGCDPEAARTVLAESLATKQALFPDNPEHPSILATLQALAEAKLILGQTQAALQDVETVLAAYERAAQPPGADRLADAHAIRAIARSEAGLSAFVPEPGKDQQMSDRVQASITRIHAAMGRPAGVGARD